MTALEVLIVEDSEKDAALMIRELKKGGFDPHSERVASAAALRDALRRKRWDLVLADFELPSFDAFAALEIVRSGDPDVPCVVVSGRIGEEVAVEAMRAGAQDFVPKDRLLRLGAVVQREMKDAEGRRAQSRDAKRIAAQHAISTLLATGRPMRELLSGALGVIAEHLAWDFAAFWEWDPTERLLRAQATWGEAEAFASATWDLAIHPGVDLPGRCFEVKEPVCRDDYALEPAYPRAALAGRSDLHGALAVPVSVGEEICCVLELLRHRAGPVDRGIAATMETLASQIGQAIGRERAINALRESEARKAAVLQASLDAVITIDHRGRVLEFNPAAERIFGYSRDEVLGEEMAELIVPVSLRDAHRRGIARYLATGVGPLIGRRVELPAMRKDGTEIPAEIVITRVDTTGDPVFTGFVRDMTQSVRLFDAVQAAEARQRLLAEVGATLVESLDHASVLPRLAVLLASELCDWCTIHVIDAGGALARVAVAHRLSHKMSLVERLWRRPSPAARCEIGPAHVAHTGSVQLLAEVGEEDLARMAEGDTELAVVRELGVGSYLGVPLSARGAPLGVLSLARARGQRAFDEDEVELAVEIARRCATALDNARLYREVQESLRARDDFLALAAHELSTPLTPLRMRVQELSRLVDEAESGLAERVRGSVRAIDRSSRRLSELVDRLLDVSRVTVGKVALERTRFDVMELARDVVGQLGEELERAGAMVTWRVPESPVMVRWDRRRVRVALHNLLSNAMKFGPGQPIEVSIGVSGDEVEIAVRDQGPGLTAEDRGRLFERFARVAPIRQYGGFGLGLWIVRQIAEEHGGRVEVSSEPGEGARFGMILPRR